MGALLILRHDRAVDALHGPATSAAGACRTCRWHDRLSFRIGVGVRPDVGPSARLPDIRFLYGPGLFHAFVGRLDRRPTAGRQEDRHHRRPAYERRAFRHGFRPELPRCTIAADYWVRLPQGKYRGA